jgi:hypothetical protein
MTHLATDQPPVTLWPTPLGSSESLSVIMVVTERPEPLPELYAECAAALREAGYPAQFVFVSGPNHRHLLDQVVRLGEEGEPVQVLEAGQDIGEAALLRSAVAHCTGSILLVLPAYRRIDPSGLPALVRQVEAGAQLAVACRSSERDPWLNQLQRRTVHALVGGIIGGGFHDLGSGVRAMRPEVLREMPLYGEFSRFLPLLAAREGFRVEEVVLPQHRADQRTRVYSPGIYLRRLIDLAGVFFLIRFREKPLRFFGLIGSLFSLVGGLLLAILFLQRIYGQPLADRPLLLLAVLLGVIGFQSIALGLVGEIIVHSSARRRESYRLSRRL